jgi:uncharacterized membrane protein YjgN (DUF898 family)
MAADGEIDFSTRSDEYLQSSLTVIDRERYPVNHARLVAEIERRRAAAGPVDPPVTPEAVGPEGGVTRHRPVFTADAGEYFRIWIVNLALTLVTVGIYSAWAKVRKLRYLYGNTTLAGSAFAYHGEPLKILKGRAIAAVLFAVYVGAGQVSPYGTLAVLALLGVLFPWLLVKSRVFAMRMTSWRGIRFDFAEDYSGAYRALLGWGLLTLATLGLLMPRFLRERFRFVLSRTRFGTTEFQSEPRTRRFYRTAIFAVGLWFGLAMAIGVLTGVVRLLAPGDAAGAQMQAISTAVAVLVYVPFLAMILGYTQARNLNESFNSTSIGPHRLVSSLSASKLSGLYLTNILGILLTAGLFIPWAQLRLARYRLEHIEIEVHGSLDEFVASNGAGPVAAAGEEITSFMDVDFGF